MEEMEKEKKSLENSLYQLNIKNTNLQDEILDLRRRNANDKKELKEQKEQVLKSIKLAFHLLLTLTL